jgi:transcriptional regulator with XRE-family HTH domain
MLRKTQVSKAKEVCRMFDDLAKYYLDTDEIGARIDALMSENHIETKALAGYLNISYQSVYKWRNGMSVPEAQHLVYISNLFGVSVDYLLKGGDADSEKKKEEREEC